MKLMSPRKGWMLGDAKAKFFGWVLEELREAAMAQGTPRSDTTFLIECGTPPVSHEEDLVIPRPSRSKADAAPGRRTIFADMPPVAELREQAQLILASNRAQYGPDAADLTQLARSPGQHPE